MGQLLHIAASPRGKDSYSRALAEEVTEAFARARPEAGVATLDLTERPLPPLDATFVAAKDRWLAGQPMDGPQASVWAAIEDLVCPFREADAWLFSVPMWGLGLPYPLKHCLDALIQPGLTFRHDPEGAHQGLLGDRPAAAILARGDRYGPGSGREGLDFQSPHLEALVRLVGIEALATVVMEPTEGEPARVAGAWQRARQQARYLGPLLAGK